MEQVVIQEEIVDDRPKEMYGEAVEVVTTSVEVAHTLLWCH